MRRFRVAESSMLPVLAPGDEFVASSSVDPKPGDVVAVPKPGEPDFWLVKRVREKPHLEPEMIWLESDNRAAGVIDSRTFGPVRADSALTRVESLQPTTFQEACDMLADEEPIFSEIIATHGRPQFWSRTAGFATLALLILEQQVSLESAAAVYNRIRDQLGEVNAETVEAAGPARLHKLGATRSKAAYLGGLARAILEGGFDLDAIGDQDPDSARDALIAIRGIGPWTADAYLLSALGHIDIFPLGDRALQVGVGEVLGMDTAPTGDELDVLGEPWRPVRAVAARLIWHSYLNRRGRSEPALSL